MHASPHTCLGNILEQWNAGFNIILDFYAFRKPYWFLKECRGLELIEVHMHALTPSHAGAVLIVTDFCSILLQKRFTVGKNMLYIEHYLH